MAQQLSNQRIAWFNGKFMPENQVMIPFRDRSWKYGDGAFDICGLPSATGGSASGSAAASMRWATRAGTTPGRTS